VGVPPRLRASNVADHLGITPLSFGDTATLWITADRVRQGPLCVDVGANVGHYTFFMATRTSRGGRITRVPHVCHVSGS